MDNVKKPRLFEALFNEQTWEEREEILTEAVTQVADENALMVARIMSRYGWPERIDTVRQLVKTPVLSIEAKFEILGQGMTSLVDEDESDYYVPLACLLGIHALSPLGKEITTDQIYWLFNQEWNFCAFGTLALTGIGHPRLWCHKLREKEIVDPQIDKHSWNELYDVMPKEFYPGLDILHDMWGNQCEITTRKV